MTDADRITLIVDDEIIETTLGDFFADNADGFGDDQCAAIRETLACGEVYFGGGGAAPGFSVRLA